MKLSSVVYRKNVLWMSVIVMLLVSVTMINIASASPDTYFSVDPSYIAGTPTGKFQVDIRVTDAPDSYAWYICLSWNPDRLELIPFGLNPVTGFQVDIMEGDFLDRHYWDPWWEEWIVPHVTSFIYVPLDEANAEGEITIGCSLVGDEPWTSGDGWLCTLNFLAEAAGAAHLDLFDTRIVGYPLDDEGYPTATYYDNEDGLVEATLFYHAGLAGWELKVNGKAGVSVGGGLKTTVGTENLLEARVANDGDFNINVQVFFEIRDSMGFLEAIIPSSIDPLPTGTSTTVSATWIAEDPDVYYITAYSFYGELAPTSQSGISKTLRLKAVE